MVLQPSELPISSAPVVSHGWGEELSNFNQELTCRRAIWLALEKTGWMGMLGSGDETHDYSTFLRPYYSCPKRSQAY